MRVLIVGCGYIGMAVGSRLAGQGHEVFGLRRSPQAGTELRELGITPLIADITRPDTLSRADSRYDWVVHCVSASGGAPLHYEQVYREGTRHLLAWLSVTPPKCLVYTGSTSVYGQTDGSVVDEASPTHPQTATGRILLETEELLLRAAREKDFPAAILRVAAIYGPGRAYWLDQFQAGTARLQDDGQRILNLIHRDDVAGTILAALDRTAPGRIYNVVDNEPVTQLQLFEWLAGRLGCPLPPSDPGVGPRSSKRGLTSKRVSNRRIRSELGYQFAFPDFRQGFEQILQVHGGD